jgi:hypothetical protein
LNNQSFTNNYIFCAIQSGHRASIIYRRVKYDLPILGFNQINSIKGHEYTIFFKNSDNILRINSKEQEIANIAYMNNITWLANSRKSLSHQLQIANSFNHLTNIIVNPKKAELIIINNFSPFDSITYG